MEQKELNPEEDDFEEDDDPDKLWCICICRRPHNNRFMICCDVCKDWFHGTCVKVSKKKGREMEQNGIDWTCPKCFVANFRSDIGPPPVPISSVQPPNMMPLISTDPIVPTAPGPDFAELIDNNTLEEFAATTTTSVGTTSRNPVPVINKKPKKPPRAYDIYLKEKYNKLKEENIEIKVYDHAIQADLEWRRMADKTIYEKKAADLKKEYLIQMDLYNKIPRKSFPQ